MSAFSGTYDFAVQIRGEALNRVIAANFFYNQTFVPTVYLRGKGVFPDRDLYLNTPTLALAADGSVTVSIPFVVHKDLQTPNVHGTVQIQNALAVEGGALVLNLAQAPTIVDFDGPDLAGYTILLAIALGNTTSLPVVPNLPVQFDFLIQQDVLQVFLSADGQKHTPPTSPPANLTPAGDIDFVVLIDPVFIQTQLAAQITAQEGNYPIVLNSKVINVSVNSITLSFNDQGTLTLAVFIDTSLGSATASQDFLLALDTSGPEAGISVVLDGGIQISSILVDALEVLTPFVGTVLVEYGEQVANQALASAVQAVGPAGASFLSQTVFGITASIVALDVNSEYLQLEGTIAAEVGAFETLYEGINPKLPMFLNNTRTWVYHLLPCVWGQQVSGKWGTFSEADSQSLLMYATAPQPWDGCYLCLPQFHKNRPGQVISFFKIPGQSGPVSGSFRVTGLLMQEVQPEELGNASLEHTCVFDGLVPDQFGNVIVQNPLPGLSPGNWLFSATSEMQPGWEVQIKGSISAWEAWPIYLTLGLQDTSPDQMPPYDPATASGLPA